MTHDKRFETFTRRGALSIGAAAPFAAHAASVSPSLDKGPKPFPLEAVRLTPSIYLDAVQVNRAYLLRLEPDRLLHNYRVQAGLQPKGAVYGGWESDTIAGHSLGHYLSALSLMYAQTGDAACKERVDYIVDELQLCQDQSPDGYVGGFTRRRGDLIEPGKLLFEEVRAGKIHSTGFDLNGGWSPLYNWHKLLAGLLDAERYCSNRKAIGICERLAGYIEGVFAPLTPEQTELALSCEYGGIGESFAELYARTHKRRWLMLSKKFYDHKVLDPLSEQKDELANIHANTQIPKLIALARLYELTGEDRYARASAYFWEDVTTRYSYVIGGNADREYFQAPLSISKHITEQTCESCNSYNMLKLTRQLYSRAPKPAHFDYFERTHLNQILGQQNPKTGMFAYMSPLMSGTHREFSTPFDDFWCCVGTGMESHAKHGESIYWRDGKTLIVNLYIPSKLNWAEAKTQVELRTQYPYADQIDIAITQKAGKAPLAVKLRIPSWCEHPSVSINAEPQSIAVTDGYVSLHRAWNSGDVITLTLPRTLRFEATPDDPHVVAALFGPLVLAADLGPAETPWTAPAPVLVGADLAAAFSQDDTAKAQFSTHGVGRPQDLVLRPFNALQDRNTAVYFNRFTDAEWSVEQARFGAEQARLRDLQARSTDIMHLGEMQGEHDHNLVAKLSYPVIYRGRNGRDARSGGYFEFDLKTRPGPLILQATYWAQERKRRFRILVDGTEVAQDGLALDGPAEFVERDYPLPAAVTAGKETIRVRFEPYVDNIAGPVFGVRLFTAAKPA